MKADLKNKVAKLHARLAQETKERKQEQELAQKASSEASKKIKELEEKLKTSQAENAKEKEAETTLKGKLDNVEHDYSSLKKKHDTEV